MDVPRSRATVLKRHFFRLRRKSLRYRYLHARRHSSGASYAYGVSRTPVIACAAPTPLARAMLNPIAARTRLPHEFHTICRSGDPAAINVNRKLNRD